MTQPTRSDAARSDALTTQQVLDGYTTRSWRFLAHLQRSSGMEYVIGKSEGSYLWNVEQTHRLNSSSAACCATACPR
jgi:hypothetical protein